tara:strand:- start:3796 stop:4968 length:1173 start_codon:yes stop_codon:yes gene_type:complete
MIRHLIVPIIAIFILNGCNTDDSSEAIKKERISGFVQKGPFISGTSILINELDVNLSQTGKTYSTQITDNKGSFEIGNVELVSKYISLRADGFYFNEVKGERSASQITLFALSDVSDKTTVNINVLSHLEKLRVEYLISQGFDFSEAKKQAQSEILEIFSISTTLTESSEILDISQDGNNNAILLAASLILQGYRTEAEFTELLSNISSDIREDGLLSSNSLGSELINHATYLNPTSIKNNLNDRYLNLGVKAEIPNFDEYIINFINSTSFEITDSLIAYPATGKTGKNILDLKKESYSGRQFSLAANLSKGAELKIKITALGSGFFYYSVTKNNWLATEFDHETNSMYFTAIDPEKIYDTSFLLDPGTFLIEYFEMGATEPSRTKTITR